MSATAKKIIPEADPVHEVDPAPALAALARHGYEEGVAFLAKDVRLWSDGRYVVAKRLLFHWTVLECSLDNDFGYDDRWCIETYALCAEAVRAYPDNWPKGFEPPNWHRHPKTARRRIDADPSKEYIDG